MTDKSLCFFQVSAARGTCKQPSVSPSLRLAHHAAPLQPSPCTAAPGLRQVWPACLGGPAQWAPHGAKADPRHLLSSPCVPSRRKTNTQLCFPSGVSGSDCPGLRRAHQCPGHHTAGLGSWEGVPHLHPEPGPLGPRGLCMEVSDNHLERRPPAWLQRPRGGHDCQPIPAAASIKGAGVPNRKGHPQPSSKRNGRPSQPPGPPVQVPVPPAQVPVPPAPCSPSPGPSSPRPSLSSPNPLLPQPRSHLPQPPAPSVP